MNESDQALELIYRNAEDRGTCKTTPQGYNQQNLNGGN